MNWLTLGLAAILVWSVVSGWSRGFAQEVGRLVAHALQLLVGAFALISAWAASAELGRLAGSINPQQLPAWGAQIVAAWRKSPHMAQVVLLIVIYAVVSTLIHRLARPVPLWAMRLVPSRIRPNHLLGALLGSVEGVVRVVLAGILVFLALQWFSLPGLAREAEGSALYTAISDTLLRPWLAPLVRKELPVLAEGAFAPLARNISLFAVPTGSPGRQAGVLLVPKQIADLAASVANGKTTARAKAYALYEWEIHHVRYDWNKYNDYVYHHQWDQQSPLDTLKSGKGVCADYALLYAELCHAVGLTVSIDEGVGGTASEQGPHAWNRVWDPERQGWIPVDTTWGAQQDAWFDPPRFDATHLTETTIVIQGGTT